MCETTHCVTATAYIFDSGRLLLIRRATPPLTLVPPGGHLEPQEDPLVGVRREVREETGLEIELLGVAHTWFGSISRGEKPILAINYLARYQGGDIRLSSEHSEFVWVTRKDIEHSRIITLDEKGNGYQPRDLLDAFDKFALLVK